MKGSFHASVSPDGKWTAAPQIFGTTLYLWEHDPKSKNGLGLKNNIGETDPGRTSFSRDGKVLVAIDPKGQAMLVWQLAREAKDIKGPKRIELGGKIETFGVSPDGRQAAVLLKGKDAPTIVALP